MERAPTEPLPWAWAHKGAAGGPPCKARRRPGASVRVEQLREYPVRTLVFEAGDSLRQVRASCDGRANFPGGSSWVPAAWLGAGPQPLTGSAPR